MGVKKFYSCGGKLWLNFFNDLFLTIHILIFVLSNSFIFMTSEEKVEYWVKISDEDLRVAETLLKNRHHLYTGFMCHQVMEKIFKAGYEKLM